VFSILLVTQPVCARNRADDKTGARKIRVMRVNVIVLA